MVGAAGSSAQTFLPDNPMAKNGASQKRLAPSINHQAVALSKAPAVSRCPALAANSFSS